MSASPLDLARTEKPGQIQENMIAYMRLFADLPGMVMHDADAFWFVSNRAAPGNMILRARWPQENVDACIDELFAQVGLHIDEIDWMVFPSDQPTDLGRRLEARGMPGGVGGNWLWADLTAQHTAPVMLDDFHVEQVRHDQGMDEWVRVSQEGFGQELGCFYDAYRRHGYGPDAFSLHYIAYIGQTAVASGTMLDAGGTAAIYDLSTPPQFRRQGIGAAVTHALMDVIRGRGYNDTWIWSSHMARSVYQSVGFIDADFGQREYPWRQGSKNSL